MRFSQEFVDRVLEANNLVDVLSQFTQLKPAGQGYMGRCPFPDHPEKTPSFSVSELKQVYHCFGCHKKGNLFTFLMEHQGMTFPEAVEFLAQKANLPIPVEKGTSDEDQKRQRTKEIFRLNQVAQAYFQAQLKNDSNPQAIKYLHQRGLKTQADIDRFGIGWVGADWEGLVKHLQKNGFSMTMAEDAKLVKARKEGSGYFDLFRERLMFPIQNSLGEVVGFGGRVVAAGEPKYLNSPESPVFHKGRTLYGLNRAARYLRGQDQALVVEGYMDAISLNLHGIENVVATLGTAMTLDHARILRKYTDRVVLVFDGDEAGQNAANRSLSILLSAGLMPRALLLPDSMDPDDFVRRFGAESFLDLVAKAPDLFSLSLNEQLRNYRGETSQKIEALDWVQKVLLDVDDARVRKLCLEEVALKLGVEASWVLQQVKIEKGEPNRQNFRPTEKSTIGVKKMEGRPVQIELQGASQLELVILQLAFQQERFLHRILHEVLSELSHPGIVAALKWMQTMYGQDPQLFARLTSLLATHVDRPELLVGQIGLSTSGGALSAQAAQIAAQKEGDKQSQESEKLLSDAIKKVKMLSLKRQADQLALDVQRSSRGPDFEEKLQRLYEIQQKRRTLELRKANEESGE